MSFRRAALALLLALVATTRVWAADDDRELYQAEVCNAGQLQVEVAVAYKKWGFIDPYWMVDYWYRVAPGACKTVFYEFYQPNSLFSFQSFPLHLAFAFTDSTGVWGAVKFRVVDDDIAASRMQLCVSRDGFEYAVGNGKDPTAGGCPNRAGSHVQDLLIPASFDWEPTKGQVYQELLAGYGPPKRFTVALGPADRAIPLGSGSPAAPPPIELTGKPSDSADFDNVIRSAVNALPWEQQLSGPDGYKRLTPGYRWLTICASWDTVYKGSLSGLQTARAQALTNALRSFVAAHATGTLRIRVSEPNGTAVVEQIGGKDGDCANNNQMEYYLESPEGRQ